MATTANTVPTRIPSGNSTGTFIVEASAGTLSLYIHQSDLHETTRDGVLALLLSGQIDEPRRVLAFDAHEGWARDASQEIAEALVAHAYSKGEALPYGVARFVGRHVITRYAA